MGLSLFKFFTWAPQNASFLKACVSAVQGHSRSLILLYEVKARTLLFFVCHSNPGPICFV